MRFWNHLHPFTPPFPHYLLIKTYNLQLCSALRSHNNQISQSDMTESITKDQLSFDSEHRLRAENLPFDIVSS